ncbi:MAG: DedA family protein [Actinomycetota bacterium]
MARKIVEFLMPYFSNYGYYMVFFGVFLESSALLGLLVPGETVLVIAAFYAARNSLRLEYVILLAFLAAVLGDNLGYFIGLRGGRPFLKKYERYFFVSEKRLRAVERYYKNHGGKTVFIARFTAFLRALAAITAGVSRMEYKKFFLYDLLGALVWAPVVSILGYFLGYNWPLLEKILNRIGLGMLIIFVLIIVGVYVYRRRRRFAGIE